MFLHLDCRHYLGDRPCKFDRLCEGCPHYLPMGPRVLIIKFGALGDVVRTGAILPGLTQITEEEPHVTWITSPAAEPLVRRMPGVDRVWVDGRDSMHRLAVERFDVVISLDKEPEPCALAMTARTERRLGIGLSRYGTPFPLNEHADYYFELGLNNEEKFRVNRKSYQELMYEALGLEYHGERFEIELTDADRAAADRKIAAMGGPPAARWVGLNPGAGGVFAYKAWRESGYVALVRGLAAQMPELRFMLLGGAREDDLLDRLMAALPGVPIHNAGTDNDLGAFAALIDRCELLVCGDTLAMHLALARRRRVVAMFGPTCEQEIDLFGQGVKLASPIECSPCYRRTCDKSPTCQDLISDARVIEAALAQLGAGK